MDGNPIIPKILTLLKKIEIDEITELRLLTGGANNRVYLLTSPHHFPLIAKHYFHHPKDPRPRLKTEFSFLSYAWNLSIRCIPQPLACDLENQLGLYSYIPGTRVTEQDLSEHTLSQAIDFFLALNKKTTTLLPAASEACLSPEDFLKSVEKRLAKILTIQDAPLQDFLKTTLIPKWNQIKKQLGSSLSHIPLTREELCLTPSDFGFHNALKSEQNIYFIDFEYGGIDDPAKTALDFFSQPKIPIPMHYFETAIQKFASVSSHPEKCLQRIKQLLPLCRLKWCCILLNSYLTTDQERRSFAYQKEENSLQKTQTYFQEHLCNR